MIYIERRQGEIVLQLVALLCYSQPGAASMERVFADACMQHCWIHTQHAVFRTFCDVRAVYVVMSIVCAIAVPLRSRCAERPADHEQ